MTSGSLRFRVLAFILAGALPATLGIGAFGAHPCPHHDGLTAAHDARAADPGSTHASHAASAQDEGPGEQEQHGPCNCVGSCTMSGGVALGSRADVQRASVQSTTRTASSGAVEAPPRDRPDFLIPFATAPPQFAA
jgi:hypothetical protein